MQNTIHQVGPAEYELEIKATADELAPEIDKALRAQRARTSLKGFRPGKVPVSLVKKMYGQALAYGVAEKSIQEVYEAEVVSKGEYEVLGQPKLTVLDYEMDGDLRAVIRFGVRPEFELEDLSGEKVTKLVHRVSDEDVEQEITRVREREADLVPLEAAAGDEDFVLIDIQRLDDASGTPIIGDREEDVSFFLNDPRLKEPLRDALLGKQAGDTFRVDLPHEHDHDDAPQSELLELPTPQEEHPAHPHTHAYQVTVKEVKRRDLPELNEEFIKKISDGKAEDEASLRDFLRQRLEQAWEQRSREFLDEKITERMLELHPIPVPESVVDVYLDSFVEDVKQRNQGKLPPGFDEALFREQNRQEAERQARWMLIRDRVIEQEGVEVTEEDLERHFERMAADGELGVDTLRQFYTSIPNLMEQLNQRLLSEKVFLTLEQRFEVVEKDRDTIQREIEERSAEAAAAPDAEAPEAEAPEAEAPEAEAPEAEAPEAEAPEAEATEAGAPEAEPSEKEQS